jgi:RNA polymerase sigma-70 factor (ECF subfamily)
LADLEDRVLIRAMAVGDSGALEKLYDRYAHLLYSFALRMVGESAAACTIVEHTFSSAWRLAAEVADQRGTVGDWLISHVHTAGIARAHQQRARSPETGADRPDLPGSTAIDIARLPRPAQDLDPEFSELRTLVKELLRGLSHHRRQAVDLAYFQGYSREEISPLVQEPLVTVSRDLTGTLVLLSRALEESGAEQTGD